MGGYLGHLWTQTSKVSLTMPTQQTQVDIASVQYRGESFKSPQYYGYRVTWIPPAHRWLGIEGEFIHAKVFAETSEAVDVQGTCTACLSTRRSPFRPLSNVSRCRTG